MGQGGGGESLEFNGQPCPPLWGAPTLEGQAKSVAAATVGAQVVTRAKVSTINKGEGKKGRGSGWCSG